MPSQNEIKEVPCMKCNAEPGQLCMAEGSTALIGGFHAERVELRKRFPCLPEDQHKLTTDDKVIITYLAFVMLCDSVAANSEKMMGAVHTSEDIQRRFAFEASLWAKAEGMIGAKIEDEPVNRKERRAKKKLIIIQ